jgi:fluoroquinolone resistance protein
VFARLARCKLVGSTFVRCEFRPMTVEAGDWSYVVMRGENLRGISFAGVGLAEADLSDADLTDASLAGADLAHARLRGVKLHGADLRGAVLDGCDVDLVDWKGVRIDVAQAVLLAQARGARVD